MTAPDPIDILARTIWGEARGECIAGMEAVACVILNRALHPRWWGRDIVSVCQAPWQFSCWNEDDPNRSKLLAVDGGDPQFMQALLVADRAVRGKLHDATNGADSYCDMRFSHPAWALDGKPVAKIGNHTFFRLET